MAGIYPLFALLNLRQLRQDKAMHQVGVCERALVRARKDVETAIQKHGDFLEWLAREEARRYQGIMETDMTLDDLEEFKAGLLGIRGMEAGFLEAIIRAKHRREVCEMDLKQAKADLLEAQKGTLKIEVHRERWMELMKREEERSQDLELEEFITPTALLV